MVKGEVPAKKIISIICTVLTVLVIALTAGIIINLIYCRVNNKPVSFFGVSFAIVQTNSMEPYIMTGDLIVYKSCSFDDVKVGDNIVFIAGDGFGKLKGQSIVHEAIEITEEGIVTQGKNRVTNPGPDKDCVTAKNLLGICTFNSAGWGKLFTFISKFGIFIIIALVAVPFIIKQIIKIVRLSKQEETASAPNVDETDSGNLNQDDSNKTDDNSENDTTDL